MTGILGKYILFRNAKDRIRAILIKIFCGIFRKTANIRLYSMQAKARIQLYPVLLSLEKYIVWLIFPFIYALIAITFFQQDSNWDLRNYHWYNPYAFLNNRYSKDFFPSGVATFYNPLIDIPFYLLATHLNAKPAVFILALVQGLNFPLLYYIGRKLFPQEKLSLSFALGLVGICGAMGISEIGTTFNDNIVSLGVLGSILITLNHLGNKLHRFQPTFLSALPLGICVGLKQTTIIYAFGSVLAFLFLEMPVKNKAKKTIFYALGILVGFLGSSGYWMYFLWKLHKNPIFPYLNKFFKSTSLNEHYAFIVDTNFIPPGFMKLWITYHYTVFPLSTIEVYWRDYRMAIWFSLVVLTAILSIIRIFEKKYSTNHMILKPENPLDNKSRYLLSLGILSYGAWLFVFGVYRYLVPLEMLAPLMIALYLRYLSVHTKAWLLFFLGYSSYLLFLLYAQDLTWFQLHYGTWLYLCCRLQSPWPYFISILILVPIIWFYKKSQWSWRASTWLFLAIIMFALYPGHWERTAWRDKFATIEIPPIYKPEKTMILMAGNQAIADVIPSFPPQINFIRIQSRFFDPTHLMKNDSVMHADIDQKIKNHLAENGLFLALYMQDDEKDALQALKIFGLEKKSSGLQDCSTIKDNLMDGEYVYMMVQPVLLLCNIVPISEIQ